MFGIKDISHNNIDYPEPSLDGIYYSSKCHANWRLNSRKVLTVVTDARYQGPSAEVCTTVPNTSPDFARKGAASCTIGDGTNTQDYVTRGYYENQNNEDCFLDPPSSGWTSSFVIPPRTWSYDATRKQNRLPGAGENYIGKAKVSAAL